MTLLRRYVRAPAARAFLVGVAAMPLFFAPLTSREVRAAAPLTVAVPDVGFTDSSGEPVNQDAAHHARLAALAQALRSDLGRDGRLASLAIPCGGPPCALDEAGVERLRGEAAKAGASLMLVAGVHKMSTLVLSMKVGVIDVATGKVVLQRLLSFRGDNDEGWRRAGSFVAKDVAEALAKEGAPPEGRVQP